MSIKITGITAGAIVVGVVIASIALVVIVGKQNFVDTIEQRAKADLRFTYEELNKFKLACGAFPKPEYFAGPAPDCFEKAGLKATRMKDFKGNRYVYFSDGEHLFLKTTYPFGMIIDETGTAYVSVTAE